MQCTRAVHAGSYTYLSEYSHHIASALHTSSKLFENRTARRNVLRGRCTRTVLHFRFLMQCICWLQKKSKYVAVTKEEKKNSETQKKKIIRSKMMDITSSFQIYAWKLHRIPKSGLLSWCRWCLKSQTPCGMVVTCRSTHAHKLCHKRIWPWKPAGVWHRCVALATNQNSDNYVTHLCAMWASNFIFGREREGGLILGLFLFDNRIWRYVRAQTAGLEFRLCGAGTGRYLIWERTNRSMTSTPSALSGRPFFLA